MRDMSCILELNLFQYNLELKNKPGDVETLYTQQGAWSWGSENPGNLKFFEKSASLEQRWYPPGYMEDVTWWSSRSSRGGTTWSCSLIFSEDYKALTLFELDSSLSFIELPDSAAFVLTRVE